MDSLLKETANMIIIVKHKPRNYIVMFHANI